MDKLRSQIVMLQAHLPMLPTTLIVVIAQYAMTSVHSRLIKLLERNENRLYIKNPTQFRNFMIVTYDGMKTLRIDTQESGLLRSCQMPATKAVRILQNQTWPTTQHALWYELWRELDLT